MMIDIHFERGFAEVDYKFGDSQHCHFPLFNFLKPLSFQWMCQVYLVMWLGNSFSYLYIHSFIMKCPLALWIYTAYYTSCTATQVKHASNMIHRFTK